ncbi:MAG: DUF4827 family protein [Muribaculaceae bacterium]|nr:DUF4827 family protein [Muribaculaceae bacterium]
MKKNSIVIALVTIVFAVFSISCEDTKSYAELLSEEDAYVNNFLSDNKVILEIPADTIFEYGPNAPYYRIDNDGMLYMQVINPGTPGNKVQYNEQIYFRYTRYMLSMYKEGKLPNGEGNNLTLGACWFRYSNFQIESSYMWGYGVQYPLSLLPVDCEVNLVVKSQMGPTSEQTDVLPYLWHLTFERRR